MNHAAKTLTATSDTSSILKALSATFTNSTTFVGELMQNARRAGATSIAIKIGEGFYEITDDGIGIADFAKLLSIAISGWDESVQKSDSPYGLGFLSTIYASQSIEVASGHTMFAATREQILGLEEVQLQHLDTPIAGAVIRMHGINQTAQQLLSATQTYALGFPLPVTIDGVPVERKHAVGVLDVVATSYGHATPDVARGAPAGHFYLQGLPIRCERRSYAHTGVVHLDPILFRGRLPDRNELCNANESEKEFSRLWRENAIQELGVLAESMGSKDFITQYGKRLQSLGAWDMLFAMDHFPADWVCKYSETPRKRDSNSDSGKESGTEAISRDQIASTAVYVETAEGYGDEWKQMLVAHLLHANNKTVANYAPEKHWISDHVLEVAEENVELVPGNVIASETTDIHYASIMLVLVDSLSLRLTSPVHGLPEVTPVPLAFDESEGKLYFTLEGSDDTYSLMYQVADFVDGESEVWDEASESQSRERVESTIRAMIHQDPSSLLDAVLRSGLPWRTPDMLKGGNFQVSFDAEGTFKVLPSGAPDQHAEPLVTA